MQEVRKGLRVAPTKKHVGISELLALAGLGRRWQWSCLGVSVSVLQPEYGRIIRHQRLEQRPWNRAESSKVEQSRVGRTE